MRSTSFSLARRSSLFFGLLLILTLANCGISQPAPVSTRITSDPWQTITAPAGQRILAHAVSPVDPATLYICAGDSAGAGQVRLWRTRDGGTHWSRLNVPDMAGSGCQIHIDSAQGQFLTVVVSGPNGGLTPCAGDTFLWSGNSGYNWQRISHPDFGKLSPEYSYCDLQVAAAHLYLWISYGSPSRKVPQVSMLERSDDAGTSWTEIDASLGHEILFVPPRIALDGKTLAVSVLPVRQSGYAGTSVLWTSHDAGQTWQEQGPVPGRTLVLAPRIQPAHGSTLAPFYNLAGEQLPEAMAALRVYQSSHGRGWSELPPLPVPGTSERQHGLLQALAVTDDGRLLAFGVDPKAGLSTLASGKNIQNTAPFWLWIWNPAITRWQVLSLPLTEPASAGCGLCWGASLSTGTDHKTYLTVASALEPNDPSSGFHLYRVRVPDA
ncbi:MAG TPA: sialidase family protein [Ktedonobacteraceae bacterium]